MDVKRKIRILTLIVSVIITVGFIWGNSCLSVEQSAEESGKVFNWLKVVFDFIFGKDVVDHNGMRKITHFCEFFLLGVEINALFYQLHGKKKESLFKVLPIGLAVAIIDESIQILSHRGPAVVDVLIDFSGYVTACFVSVIFVIIMNKIKIKKTNA
ncbi:MAG: VanZ family protein [Clostridia bacterium]|nr:VanZ family protein [Clostridia bacterium]